MANGPSGTGQLRKLIFNKYHDDTYGVRWKLSTLKVLFWMILATILLVVSYSFFAPDQKGYLSNTIFLAIITMIIIMVLWIIGNFVWKSRKFVAGFIITIIVLFAIYFTLGLIFSYLLGWTFHYGFSTWLIFTVLSGIGAKNFDDKIERRDFFFAVLVLVVFIFGNAPAFASGGFLAEIDTFISTIQSTMSSLTHTVSS